jgi:hypothetical protein
MNTIASMLGIKGDAYKRLGKIIKKLRSAFQQAGLSGHAEPIESSWRRTP